MSLRSHKRGNIIDILLTPTFTTVVALGIVFVVILRTIYGIGSDIEYNKQFFAADIALQAESLYTVRQDVNLVIEYPAPKDLGINIESKLVTVYKEKPRDGRIFWFNEDKAYGFSYAKFKPDRKEGEIKFFKEGNSIGVLAGKINPATPYCERRVPKKTQATIDYGVIKLLGTEPVYIVTGNILVAAHVTKGEPTAVIYINEEPESERLACEMVQNLVKNLKLEGYAILPLNPDLLHPEDPRKEVAKSKKIAAFVHLTLPVTDSQAKGQIGQAITSEVKDYLV